jgi:hypothetical protein
MKTQRLAIALTVINLALLLLSAGFTGRASSQIVEPVLRGRSLELVGDDGVIRTRLEVKPDGTVLLQLFDQNGIVRAKLGAGEHGSGLFLADESNETGIQLVASRDPPPDQPATTRIRVSGARGARLITPCRQTQHCSRP